MPGTIWVASIAMLKNFDPGKSNRERAYAARVERIIANMVARPQIRNELRR